MTMGGVMAKLRTKTEAQGYAPDWPALEEHFPEVRDYAGYTEKWAYIEARCLESKEDAKFVKKHRPKIANSHRVIIDKVITNAFCEFIVDQLIAESSAFGDFKYHDSGIGTGAEAAGDTALGTPWGGSRDVGTQVEDSSKVYKSIATTTYNATKAITEHGLFTASSGVTLMDRTKFSAINVVNGNQIQWEFTIGFTSGG